MFLHFSSDLEQSFPNYPPVQAIISTNTNQLYNALKIALTENLQTNPLKRLSQSKNID